jgi:phage tail sheath protein FI
MMLIWPNTSTGDIAARAMGLRALIDQTTGWHKTVSNVALTGVTATDVPVTWTLDGANSDAADLNAAQITTIVNTGDAWVLWGNRTTASGTELPYAFESATRTSQIIQDTIDTARLKYTDQPMDKMLIKMIIDETRRWLRKLVTKGQLIGASVWWDPASNVAGDLADGQAVFDYDFTPVAPLEGQTNNQRITSVLRRFLVAGIGLIRGTIGARAHRKVRTHGKFPRQTH